MRAEKRRACVARPKKRGVKDAGGSDGGMKSLQLTSPVDEIPFTEGNGSSPEAIFEIDAEAINHALGGGVSIACPTAHSIVSMLAWKDREASSKCLRSEKKRIRLFKRGRSKISESCLYCSCRCGD